MAKSPDKPGTSQKPAGGRTPWGRRILTLLIAVAAVGGFAMIVVYSYDRGKQSEDGKTAPLIEARTGPTKVRPAEAGGMIIPNQDKQVYERLEKDTAKDRVETLLPPPEPIIAKPSPVMGKTPPPAPAPQRSSSNGGTPTDSNSSNAASIAKIEKTAPASGAATPAVIPPPPAPPTPPTSRTVVVPKAAPPAVTAAIVSPPAPAKAVSVKPGWRVQIASLRSKKAANAAWTRLAKRHAGFLRGLEPHVVRADLKKRGIYYRLQAGPIASRSEAVAFCKRAKARKIGCIIVRP